MKICWDNLERVRLSKRGNLKIGTAVYIEKDSCANCGQPYLAVDGKPIRFCSLSCAHSGKNHHMYGKTHSVTTKEKISKARKGHVVGSLNTNWKGGAFTLGFAGYDIYKDRLEIYENIRKQEDTGILEAKCVYCGKWFVPTYRAVRNRIMATIHLNSGECRLYCSENCKQACPTYWQQKYPKGFKHVTSREVNPYLRQMVLERDNWACQICGKTSKEAQLHVHHMDPVAQNPMFQNDMDSCITLCKCCHTFVHKQRGCRYIDLRCNRETDYTRKFKEGIRLKSTSLQE